MDRTEQLGKRGFSFDEPVEEETGATEGDIEQELYQLMVDEYGQEAVDSASDEELVAMLTEVFGADETGSLSNKADDWLSYGGEPSYLNGEPNPEYEEYSDKDRIAGIVEALSGGRFKGN